MQAIVDELMTRLVPLMESNMAYIGTTMFEEDGDGFNREVVKSFAVDGGCATFSRGARWKRSADMQKEREFAKIAGSWFSGRSLVSQHAGL